MMDSSIASQCSRRSVEPLSRSCQPPRVSTRPVYNLTLSILWFSIFYCIDVLWKIEDIRLMKLVRRWALDYDRKVGAGLGLGRVVIC
ncbi:hypothetical protein Y032_0106g3727 [Ancylostoma ceylanicum]|nr:hypothetical protein Y032_0106g3727 [Ancylostoma ceylanicum]